MEQAVSLLASTGRRRDDQRSLSPDKTGHWGMNDTVSNRTLTTNDGYRIAARLFEPEQESRATVVIAPAMGVPQSWYEPFARWLAGQGYRVTTFDYRGMGSSRPRSLRGFSASIVDWARFDAGTVIDWRRGETPDEPLIWLGHSVGGQILGFLPNHDALERIVTVAAGSGYWRDNAPGLRRKVWLLWYVLAPTLTPLLGYFPGQKLGMVGDLPRGVIRQWRRWCLHPHYAAGVEAEAREGYASIRSPIVSLSFTDDELMSRTSIQSLHALFTEAPSTMLRLTPSDAGTRRIGHFGIFRSEHVNGLWSSHLLPAIEGRLDGGADTTGTTPHTALSE
jgi:predicted alpha/beta hydrolase